MTDPNNIFQLLNVGWELTYACNMRCKHCGSSCGRPKPDELSTEEALRLCDEIAAMRVHVVTLLGGEPLLRKDWDQIARRLTTQGITTNLITNGWLVDDEIVERAITAGLNNMAVSIDGLEETHDFIRMHGSFARAIEALRILRRHGLPSCVITTIGRQNLPELPALKEIFIAEGVERWQLQIAEPMGNLVDRRDFILAPEDLDKVVDFAYATYKEGKIIIDIGDNIGYYDVRIVEMNKSSDDDIESDGIWTGCSGGICLIGIRCNGDIVPCLSLRDEHYIEGNVRTTPLKEIWARPGAFAWNRDRKVEELKGFCGSCSYAELCFGGCTTLKLTTEGSLAENRYCLYQMECLKEQARIDTSQDLGWLLSNGHDLLDEREFDLAERCLEKALALSPDNIDCIDGLGFIKFELDKIEESLELNERSLHLDPRNAYALKGKGMCLAMLGKLDEGIAWLRRAIEAADPSFLEPSHDLAAILIQHDRLDEAETVIDAACARSEEFRERCGPLREALRNRRQRP